MTNEHLPQAPVGEFLLFKSADGSTRGECRFEAETLWLSQASMVELYDKDVRTINEHLINIYKEGELEQNATIRKFRMVRQEGTRQVSREIEHYNLEAILAVGYRVRSARGTQFRQWATQNLQEYLIKGFVMDDERLEIHLVEHRLYLTISTRCWNASAISAPASAGFICGFGRSLR